MAENTRPSSSLPPAMSSKQRRTSRQPMANLEDSTNRTQLISPPPEETLNHLRRVSRTGPSTPQISNPKRKRNISQGTSQPTEGNQIETTPNPKPRKQLKNRLSFLESPTKASRNTPGRLTSVNPKSPHAENPDADWLPPIPSSASRRETVSARARKTTPIPAYEPPADVFTPPKEVMLVPTISKSSKRKTPANRGRTSVTPCLTITIKKELPPIDLTAPMPPPSPSDDPLLLSGPPEMSTPIRPRRNLPSFAESPPQSPLPPSSEPDDDDEMEQVTERFDWTKHTVPEGSTDDMSMEIDEQDRDVPPIPLFDLNYAGPADNSTGWDSSDEEDDELPVHNGGFFEEGEGEFTGRWRQTRIPTKADPPSSATRDRMEEWGRPITPFPREKIKRLSLVKEAAAEEDREPGPVAQDRQGLQSPSRGEDEDEEEEMEEAEEREVREMSIPLNDEDEQIEEARTATLFKATSPPRVVDARFDFDQFLDDEEPEPAQFEPQAPLIVAVVDSRFNFDQSFEDSLEVEVPDMIHDELSLPHDDVAPAEDATLSTTIAVDDQNSLPKLPEKQREATPPEEDEDEEEEREVRDLSVDFRGEEEDEDEAPGAAAQSILDGLETPGQHPSATQLRTIRHSPSPGPPHQFPAAVRPQAQAQSPPAEREPLSQAGRFTQRTFAQPKPVHTSYNIPSTSAPVAQPHRRADIVVEPDMEEGGSDSEDDSYDLGIVKITSADPRAAARAAAILKQHDYDCFTKIMMKQRKRSFTPGKAPSRRNSVIGGGIVKQSNISEIEKLKKRRATMGVIGETAYIPGSPAKTLPQLLKEAEAEVSVLHSPRRAPSSLLEGRNPFETPFSAQQSPASFQGTTPTHIQGRFTAPGKREWSKEEWKLLDACFTDERLEVGGGDVLASVDEVQLIDVVARFVGLMGGDKAILSYGDDWNRESLLHRVATLQAKQRSGKIAPPTTPFATPASPSTHCERQLTPEPAATPLSRRGLLPQKSQSNGGLDCPVALKDGGLFANLSSEPEEEASRRKVPLSLLAPRYSHLLQEAIEISQPSAGSSNAVLDLVDQLEEDEGMEHVEDPDGDVHFDDANEAHARAQGSTNIGKRVKGFITSYLPTLKNSSRSSKQRSTIPRQPGLPLPPKDLQGKPRGPIATPARPAPQRPKHPKDIVHLQPAPLLGKNVAPATTKPKRLVDLQPVPIPEVPKPVTEAPRPRRSSGASVKDLVKGFEEKEKEAREVNGKGAVLKRICSVDGRRHKLPTASQPGKLTWRP